MEEARRQRAMDCPFADPARQARSARAFAAVGWPFLWILSFGHANESISPSGARTGFEWPSRSESDSGNLFTTMSLVQSQEVTPCSDPVEEKRRQLLDRYHQCSRADRAVVDLLAVAWGGLNKSQITTPLRKILSAGEASQIKLDALHDHGL